MCTLSNVSIPPLSFAKIRRQALITLPLLFAEVSRSFPGKIITKKHFVCVCVYEHLCLCVCVRVHASEAEVDVIGEKNRIEFYWHVNRDEIQLTVP